MSQYIVINKCFGGFGLSPEATLWLYEKGCGGVDASPVTEYFKADSEYARSEEYQSRMGHQAKLAEWRRYLKGDRDGSGVFLSVFSPDEQFVLYARDVKRDDPLLIQCVREMGEAANGSCADLKIVEIPDGVEWEISEYDGNEHIAQQHQTWG